MKVVIIHDMSRHMVTLIGRDYLHYPSLSLTHVILLRINFLCSHWLNHQCIRFHFISLSLVIMWLFNHLKVYALVNSSFLGCQSCW